MEINYLNKFYNYPIDIEFECTERLDEIINSYKEEKEELPYIESTEIR